MKKRTAAIGIVLSVLLTAAASAQQTDKRWLAVAPGRVEPPSGIVKIASPAIGIVAETSCQFLQAASFPDTIHAGLAVERLGTSSIVYRIALFRNGDEAPCAVGRFVPTYVDRITRRPVPIPPVIRNGVGQLKSV